MDAKQVITQYNGLIYSVCKRKLDDHSLLEDAIQSVYLLFYEKGVKEKREDYSSWFYWASVNACAFINKNEKKLISLTKEPESKLLEKEDRENRDESIFDDIELELKKISKKNLQLILWYFFDRKTYLEIDKILNTSEDAIRMRLKRLTVQIESNIKNKRKVLDISQLALYLGSASNLIIPAHGSLILESENLLLSKKLLLIKQGVSKMILLSKINAIALPFVMVSAVGVGAYAYEFGGFNKRDVSKDSELVKNAGDIVPIGAKADTPKWLETKITLEFQEVNINEALENITTLVGGKISINKNVKVEGLNGVTLTVKDLAVKNVLALLLEQYKLTYKVLNANEIEIINKA